MILGCVNQAGEDNRNVARMASLLAGIPYTVPAATVNRLCGSGMEAVSVVARAIAAGEISSRDCWRSGKHEPQPVCDSQGSSRFLARSQIYDTTLGWRFVNPLMEEKYGIDSMAETAENVAEAYTSTAHCQDQFALRSHQKAAAAQKAGIFAEEIVPVNVPAAKREL